MDKITEFDYLLNRMERAAQQEMPAEHDYGTHRASLMHHVRALERDAERWRKARRLARYSPSTDGGDYVAFDSLPWPRTCHATTPEYADAAIDAADVDAPAVGAA